MNSCQANSSDPGTALLGLLIFIVMVMILVWVIYRWFRVWFQRTRPIAVRPSSQPSGDKPHIKCKRGVAHFAITGSSSQRTEYVDLPAGRYKLQLWPPEGNALMFQAYDLHNQDQHDLAVDVRDVHAAEITLRESRYEFTIELADLRGPQHWEITLERVGD